MPGVIFVKTYLLQTENRETRLMEELFEALADRTRLRILNLLARGEICVCYFTAILEAPQPTVSRHLAYLRRKGLVTTRREGKWIHYRLAQVEESSHARILDAILQELSEDEAMQRDVVALRSACCATRLPGTLAEAPRPKLLPDSPS